MMPQQERTSFQQLLEHRAALAVDWLVRSIEACGGQGSARFYSRVYEPRRGWSWPYPETTGYIIPTLYAYARFANRPELAAVATRQADWVISLQYDNGALPGGHVENGRKAGPSIFNTGQMIFGLVAAYDETGDAKYLSAARRAAEWLAAEVDPASGTWTSHGYVGGHSPAYYTRVCWPMLEVHARAGGEAIRSAAVRVLTTIAGWQNDTGAFANWAFKPGRPGYTHTIAYTIDGMLESAWLLGPDGEAFERAAMRCADVLRRRIEYRGGLAGAYDEQFRGVSWYTCLTGNCQLASIWMRIAERHGDARFLSAAIKALQFVIDRQRVRPLDRHLRGAIAGSSPVWGRYLTLRYPNWAAKFFVDACLAAHAAIEKLLNEGPCVSPSPVATAPACTLSR
jgi:hypothetical protein